MKNIRISLILMASLVLSDTAAAITTTFTNYGAFVNATADLNVVANALSAIPVPTEITSGTVIEGVGYSFDIFNRSNPNLPNSTTAQVVSSGGRVMLTPFGAGTSFQPGGLSRNDTVTLSFSSPVTAFGVSLGIAPQSTFSIVSDTGLYISTAGFSSYGEQTATYADYFLGLLSDTPFNSVTLSGGNIYMGGRIQPFSGWAPTRITYSTPSAVVPIPGSGLLFLGALAACARLIRVGKAQ